MALTGGYALIQGKIFLSKEFFLTNTHARIVGLMLLLPVFGLVSMVCFKMIFLGHPFFTVFGDIFVTDFTHTYESTIYLVVASLAAAAGWMLAFRQRASLRRTT